MPLKSLTRTPPCGWIYHQPQTGWRPPKNLTTFNQVTGALRKHRLANPHLNLNTDLQSAKDDVEAYICAFLKNDAAWCVVPPGEESKKSFAIPALRQAGVAAAGVAGSVRRVAAGAAILHEWLGSGGKEVSSEQANTRASVCHKCPLNQPGNWKDFFKGAIAKTIRSQLAMRHDLKLSTPIDDKLGYCQACGCWLPLKVWVPIEPIAQWTTAEVQNDLAKGLNCWVLQELQSMEDSDYI